jgi:hypothetical protein
LSMYSVCMQGASNPVSNMSQTITSFILQVATSEARGGSGNLDRGDEWMIRALSA